MQISLGTGTTNLLNPKVRRQKFGVGSFLALFVAGAVFVGAGYLLMQSTKIDPSWTRVEGKVIGSNPVSGSTNSGVTYAPVVQYTVNGTPYTITSGSSSSIHPSVGSQKEVAYNPQSPNDAKVVDGTGTKAILAIFPVIGIVLLILAPVLLVRSMHRSKDITNLRQSGQKLQGIITNIQTANTNNNVTTYKIEVSATDQTGAVKQYVSDSLTGIGGLAMADYQTNPIPIDVYVNPANPNDYYVDISDVPNLTPDRIKQLISEASSGQLAGMHGATPPFAAPQTQASTPVAPSPSPTEQNPPVNPVQ